MVGIRRSIQQLKRKDKSINNNPNFKTSNPITKQRPLNKKHAHNKRTSIYNERNRYKCTLTKKY